MKTAKKTAIEKAYGEHWDTVKQNVDEDGYLHHPKGGEVTFEPFIGFMDEHPTKDAYRPKSLNGIETNNGWIRIESEEDLPKDNYGNYLVYANDGVFTSGNMGIINYWPNDKKKTKEWLSCYTHWQPIEKPEPPIY